jgi:hypothetical protein
MHLSHRLAASAPLLALALLGTGAPTSLDSPEPSASSGGPPATQIVAVQIDPSPIHPGSHVVVTVDTSPDVAAVDAYVRGLTFHIKPVQSGEFRSDGKVPWFARFFKGTYQIKFVARCASGQSTEYQREITLN